MFDSVKKLSKLPKNTKIYCGHEYTLSNLKFALEVDPDNSILKDEYKSIENILASGMPSLPTTINKELNINPFMRCNNSDVKKNIMKKFTCKDNEFEIFTTIRKWKDSY